METTRDEIRAIKNSSDIITNDARCQLDHLITAVEQPIEYIFDYESEEKAIDILSTDDERFCTIIRDMAFQLNGEIVELHDYQIGSRYVLISTNKLDRLSNSEICEYLAAERAELLEMLKDKN